MGTPVRGFGDLKALQPWGSLELSLAIPWVHPVGAPSTEGGGERRGQGKDRWYYPQETWLYLRYTKT